MKNWKIKIGIWLVMISKLSYGQDISFSSEYNQIKWPLSLGVGGGLVGDDGNYKRLSLFHGHSISLQTGTNTPNISNSRLYISSTGAVGVGTTSPEATFHLVGGFRQGGTGAFNVDASGVVGGRFKILENGNVGVGTADPLARLDVRGGATNVDYLTVRPQGGPEGGEITLQGGAGYPAWQLDILNNQFRLHSQGSVLLSVENSGFIAGAGNASFRDLISGGSNAWLLHTPDDGRSELFLAPMIDQKWAFDKQFVFKNDGMMQLNSASITSKLGIGTAAPLASMHVKGGGLILGSNSVVGNTDGYLSMGDANKNSSPTTYTWGTETTLLLTNQDYSTIGFHDVGERVDFIRAGKGTIQLGYDGGYGSASVGLPNGVWNSLGNVGIGTTNPGSYKLAVEGKIGAREVEVKTGSWADFVFKDDYKLRSIEEVEKYIAAHLHLPEIPSEEKVKAEGVNLGEMNVKLLQKIEELTLYMIQQQHEISIMKNQITKLVEDNKKK